MVCFIWCLVESTCLRLTLYFYQYLSWPTTCFIFSHEKLIYHLAIPGLVVFCIFLLVSPPSWKKSFPVVSDSSNYRLPMTSITYKIEENECFIYQKRKDITINEHDG